MKSRWEVRRLGDVLEVQNGYAFESKDFNPTKGMPLIRIRSLKSGTETETFFNGDYEKKYVVNAGDLLIGMDGEFGCYEWKGEPALLNQRVCRLRGFSDELVPRFLFYGVNDHLKAIEDLTGYTTVKHLSSKQILDIEFPVPPLIYSLKEGINDGFLTPFKVKQVSTTLDEYVYTPDDRLIEGEIKSGKRYTEPDFNKIIEIKEREAHRAKLFMDMIDQREKTLVFCATQDHALAVRDLVNQMKTSTDPNYCQRVTANDGALGDQYLRDFQDNEKTIPTILTTSQKLSTGVDARNIRNIVLMRPINSMIEFKQIIGRGTRLYDGKDYFTIYDFVKAHHHFNDPEWDGEPIEPEPKDVSEPRERVVREPERDYEPPPRAQKIKVKLADGKARTIQHMVATTFWHPDGTPMSAVQFLEMLFGRLPEFFKDEAELRALWSAPDTRAKLLQGLAEKGFGADQMAEMQKIIDAEKSDLFDVLAHVAYALPPLTREERAAHAKIEISTHFNSKQRVFLDFVLSHYVNEGVGELDQEKLTPLLRLKYNDAISDAVADLGRPEDIGKMFSGFQKYLYQEAA